MDGHDQARSVIAGFGSTAVLGLSVRAAAERLLAQDSWPERLALLQNEARLVNEAIARWCVERDEPLLAAVILRAEEVGVEATSAEVPTALALSRLGRDGSSAKLSESIGVVREATALVIDGATWLLPLSMHLVDVLVVQIRSHANVGELDADQMAQLAELRGVVEPLLISAAGCDPADVSQISTLAMGDLGEIWASLPALKNLDALQSACDVAQTLAWWFEADEGATGWFGDLKDLLQAAARRGSKAAVEEHQFVLAARAIRIDDRLSTEERLRICDALSVGAYADFRRTGAAWVFHAAIETAREAHRLAGTGHPDLARYAAMLGDLLADGVHAQLLAPAALAEAIEYQREAYQLTSLDHPSRTAYAATLGARLAQAVQARLLRPTALAEAIEYQREAYQVTPANHSNRAIYAASLSSVLAVGVHAEVLEPAAIIEAVQYQREAYLLTPSNHPLHAGFASNLGSRLSDAVQLGLLGAASLNEAVKYHREAYELIDAVQPIRVRYAVNLARSLGIGVQAGVIEPAVLFEAVGYYREAYQLAGVDEPDRAGYASNLGGLLGLGVERGVFDSAVLAEALDYHRQAYELTDAGDPNRAGRASNLGGRISEAVRAGVLRPEALAYAIQYQREAYQLTSTDHIDRAMFASNLADLLTNAVQSGVLKAEALAEAVEYQREAYQLTSSDHMDRAKYASSLAGVLTNAVQSGVLKAEALAEAVEYQREAYQLIPVNDPSRHASASTFGGLLYEGVKAGIFKPDVLVEASSYQREAYHLIPLNHPNRPSYASNLAGVLADAVLAGVVDSQHLVDTTIEILDLLDDLWLLARSGVTLTHRRRILSMTRAASARLPLMLLQQIGPQEAARAIEALRGHLVGGMHAPILRPGVVDSHLEAAYQQTVNTYEATQLLAREGLISYADAAPAASHLTEFVERIRSTAELPSFGSRPQFDELCAKLPTHTAGIYLLPASKLKSQWAEERTGAAVIIRSDGRAGQVLLTLHADAVRNNTQALLTSSASAQHVCAWLWQAVAAPLLEHAGPILVGATEWVLVPTGHLGLLPLHAAGSTETGWLDNHVTIRVTPSLMALTEPESATTPTGNPVAAVSGASDLAFLAADRAVARALIPDVLLAHPVTPDSVLEALVETPVAVLSGHAVHSLDEGGGLDLGTERDQLDAASAPRWLTAQAVERLPLRDRQWAFLSGCSSGQIATDLPDESIGLPAAFRQAGFRSVVATLWPVKDHVAFIALALFLQHRAAQPQDSVAMALRHNRIWLRNATRQDLITWLDDLIATTDIPVHLAHSLRQWWTDCPDLTPYADPQDWAPYAATGH